MGNCATRVKTILFIGCAIPSRRFDERLICNVKSKTCQCRLEDEPKLLKTYRFCPKCGKGFTFQNATREANFNIHKGELGCFTVLRESSSNHYLVGRSVSSPTNKLNADQVRSINVLVVNMKEELMETLLDVALWEEDTYGLHFLNNYSAYDYDIDDDSDDDEDDYCSDEDDYCSDEDGDK